MLVPWPCPFRIPRGLGSSEPCPSSAWQSGDTGCGGSNLLCFTVLSKALIPVSAGPAWYQVSGSWRATHIESRRSKSGRCRGDADAALPHPPPSRLMEYSPSPSPVLQGSEQHFSLLSQEPGKPSAQEAAFPSSPTRLSGCFHTLGLNCGVQASGDAKRKPQ